MESNSYQNWPTWEEIIDRSPLTVTPDTLILEAIDLMSREEDRSCVLVVDGTKLTGIFTERDVVKLTASGIDLSRTKISQAMVQPTISLTLDRNQNPLTALSLMRQHRIRHLPVLDDRDERNRVSPHPQRSGMGKESAVMRSSTPCGWTTNRLILSW